MKRAWIYLLSLNVVGLLAVAAPPVRQDKRPPVGARSVEIRGTLQVVVEDDFDLARSKRLYSVEESSTGRTYRLRLVDSASPSMKSGDGVVVRGRLRGDEIMTDFEGLERSPTSGITTRSVSGSRTALVMVVDFGDEAVSCSDGQIEGLMFTGASSVDGLYQETSFGAVSFPPDTDGNGNSDVVRVTIGALTTGSCDSSSWANAADVEAQNAGFDLGLYQHKVYILPNGAPCGWAGRATVGCAGPCYAWVRYCNMPDVLAHELGHNLLLRHASTDTNNDGIKDCEYCDLSDFMGSGGYGWRQVNGPHKYQMGWLAPPQVAEIVPGAPQTHLLSPLETDPLAAPYPQLLKIATGAGDYYYLSYRRRIGYDAGLRATYNDKTSIHRSSPDGSGNSYFVAALVDGGNLSDSNGLEVTQVSHDTSSVTLLIEGTGPGCTDADSDGYGAPGDPGCPEGALDDCDDSRSDVHPGATEVCGDGLDNDCNGFADGIMSCGRTRDPASPAEPE